jgi:GAF domain-containing protein
VGEENESARLEVLAQASQAFATVATDRRRLLDVVARTAADLVGDGCAVFLLAPDGDALRMVSAAHRDRVLEVAHRAYMASTPIRMATSTTNTASVVRTGNPVLVPTLDPAALAAKADPVLRPIIEQLNVSSLCIVPVRTRGVVIGAMAVLRSRPGVPYSHDDQKLLEELAERAGLAIDEARVAADPESH